MKIVEISSPLPDAADKGAISKGTHEDQHQSQEQLSIVYSSVEIAVMTNCTSGSCKHQDGMHAILSPGLCHQLLEP